MSSDDLYRRYDGPVPVWEIQRPGPSLWSRSMKFHRLRALDWARQIVHHLQCAKLEKGQARLDHWITASRLLNHYNCSRRQYRRLATKKP